MGYTRALLKLSFDDPELAEFEVFARRMNVAQLLDLTTLKQLAGLSDDSPEVRAALETVYKTLDEVIVRWNLEEDVDPVNPDAGKVAVPKNAQTIARQDIDLLMAMVNAIRDARADVPAPLGQPSSGGDLSLEASMPMDVPSDVPTS